MLIRFPRIRVAAWVAVFAVLLATLAPGVSHALAAAGWTEQTRIELCTLDGPVWVDEQGVPVDAGGLALSGLEHCPFCATHAGSFALPAAAFPPLPQAERVAFLPPRFLSAPRTAHAWLQAYPRAPPRAL